MIRYRSARTAPGVNPPAWIESDDASLPTREDDGGRCAFRATDGDAMFVGSCDTEDTGSPHSGQKRAALGTSDEQAGQGVTGTRFYAPPAGAFSSSSATPPNSGSPASAVRDAHHASATTRRTAIAPA